MTLASPTQEKFSLRAAEAEAELGKYRRPTFVKHPYQNLINSGMLAMFIAKYH